MRSLEQRRILDAAAAIKVAERKEAKAARPKPVIPTAQGQRRPRVLDKAFLAWLRRLPCVAGYFEGGCDGPMEAAHLRMSIPGRPNPGMQARPDDQWALPLCRHHHQHDQHKGSERAFWDRLGIDPFALCLALYSAFNVDTNGEEIIRAFALYHSVDGQVRSRER